MASKNSDHEPKTMQRFSDIAGEPRRMLAPIQGYEKMPLVSLEKAVEPLVSFVPQVNRMVWTVKQQCTAPAEGLTLDQSASIMLYSFEWSPREESFYYVLNDFLRAADRNKLRSWFSYLKLLIYSLTKLPSTVRHVYRGIKEDLHALYPEGSTFVWWGFSSCTTSVKVLQTEEFLGKTGTRTMFNIECHSGRDIRRHSFFSTEQEVLLLAARQFQVVASLDSGNGLHIIQLKEIDPPFPLLEPIQEDLLSATASLSLSPSQPVISSKMAATMIFPTARWAQNGVTVAGGHGKGSGTNQLHNPRGLHVDEEGTVIVADCHNYRIVEWKRGDTSGRVLAGGNGQGNRPDQLNGPTDMLVGPGTNTLIICDRYKRRVTRWSRGSGTRSGETIIDNIVCWGLAMDEEGSLYVTDTEKHAVRRYLRGETSGTVVAGGNGSGDGLHQLNAPRYVCVDGDHAVYVSDHDNHRVMKWAKGAKEGIVVAGGQGEGEELTQLSYPQGVRVDAAGNVYVADYQNDRVMRWCRGATQGTVVVGGNGRGEGANQLQYPTGLSFDRQGNLYVADFYNHRVQRFSIEKD